MGHSRTSLVRQLQESFCGGKLDEANRDWIVEQLSFRVRHLQSLGGAYQAVRLSHHAGELSPSSC